MHQRLGRVATAQRHHAGQRQGLGLVRVRHQRLCHRRDGVGVRLALIGREQGIGQVRQHGGLPRHQPQHLPIRRYRIRIAPQCFVGTRQRIPAVGIVGAGAQPLRQGIDGHGHVGAIASRACGVGCRAIIRAIACAISHAVTRDVGMRGRRARVRHVGHGARVAQLAVQQHGSHGDQHGQEAGGGQAGALAADQPHAGLARRQVLQQFTL
ncbi:hypothetical protein D3C85_1184740 [compost metagenome]